MTVGRMPGGTGTSSRPWLVAATAVNLATWHDANLRALGYRTAWRDGWWVTPDDVPVIFFRAIAIRPGADPTIPASVCHPASAMAACDPWSDVPLDRHGMAYEADRPWMVRDAGPLGPVPSPPGVTVARVEDEAALFAFERTAALGFGTILPSPGTWHAPGILGDRRFDHWLAWQGQEAVGTGNGLDAGGVLGVYSISTVPAVRRRGIGLAVTARTVAAAPPLPAVLQPSDMAEPLYQRLGFARFTTFRTWTRRSR